ncbi:putative TOS1-like glycosyl hydrolase-domain-containing protein [Scheffersomyces amazonensis]|uniref:putative TOS1-like glycosyl hydrolase-domain-containing protein n=1 Tax=Scheffersomyces amazonensis TaxID=1078765 RepID=UPI00315D144E
MQIPTFIASFISVALLSTQVTASKVSYVKRASSSPQQAEVLEFSNFGFSGTFNMVSQLDNIYSDTCSCQVNPAPVDFSGPNAPLNGDVSVHFRGPLVLNKFAFYVSDNFVHGDAQSSNWTRLSYYDAESQTSQNVTFLNNAGQNSTCLGLGLSYADSDGVNASSSSEILAANTKLLSNQEISIFSNVSCGPSGYGNDCGVYRSDIPAYHGFFGTTKMFIFDFEMPDESELPGWTANYNMPAIWLLNANIPRTAQYSDNVNCSCWRSGCGEFDIFEVKNNTQSEVNQLFTTIHDYQGTDDIETGLQINGYIPRDTQGSMVGGVSFDSNGNAIVWVSNSTTFDEVISASDFNSWISSDGNAVVDSLSSVPAASSASSSKKSSGSNVNNDSIYTRVFIGLFSMLFWF